MALIVVAGDALIDVFFKNETETEERQGGAENTFVNLRAILGPEHECMNYTSFGGAVYYGQDLRIFEKNDAQPLSLLRDSISLLSEYPVRDYYALIISDYNRGSVTPCNPTETIVYEPPPWDLIVVDSRHRTVDPMFLRQAPEHCLKVWHCTGREYDKEFAKMFDVVLHTNGSDRVKVYERFNTSLPIYSSFPVPQDTPVVNTAGAGDTFVAAWTAHYVKHKSIWEATEFAISAAQDVIQEPYTAITKHKI
jgi:hypothetical protein